MKQANEKAEGLTAQPAGKGPEWMAVVRVYGSILYTTKRWGAGEGEKPIPLEPSHIDGWMADCAGSGITTILWRANCAGTLTYPSRLTALAGECPLPRRYRVGAEEIEQGFLPADWAFLGEQCRRFNTLEAGVSSAHRHGLKFFLDFSTFDLVGVWCTPRQWPEGCGRTFDPDLWLWSKDQKERLAGVPCYADPRVRERRVGEIAEALAYGIDGVFLGFFSHCDAQSGERSNWYGYNPAVVDEYRRRHGLNPLRQEADVHRLYALHGEHFTQFVREASRVVRGRAKKLFCTARTDGVHGWNGKGTSLGQAGAMGDRDLRDGHSALPFAAGFYLEWERWSDEDLVDGLIAYAPFPDGMALVRQMKRRAGKPVYLMRKYSGWQGKFAPPQTLEGYQRELEAVRRGEIDGYALHLMFIVQHEAMKPDWRGLLAPPRRCHRG